MPVLHPLVGEIFKLARNTVVQRKQIVYNTSPASQRLQNNVGGLKAKSFWQPVTVPNLDCRVVSMLTALSSNESGNEDVLDAGCLLDVLRLYRWRISSFEEQVGLRCSLVGLFSLYFGKCVHFIVIIPPS